MGRVEDIAFWKRVGKKFMAIKGCSVTVGDEDDDGDLINQCFPNAGPRPGTGPWHQLYRAARGKYFIVEIF
jgi:hypothetical protein